MTGHVLFLVGGPPWVGKSSLAQQLLATDGIPWLSTDVIRTVLRRVSRTSTQSIRIPPTRSCSPR
ncbi:MAG: hypothetical protein ACRDOU_05870 [Streptosporangiaceae bacterium]